MNVCVCEEVHLALSLSLDLSLDLCLPLDANKPYFEKAASCCFGAFASVASRMSANTTTRPKGLQMRVCVHARLEQGERGATCSFIVHPGANTKRQTFRISQARTCFCNTIAALVCSLLCTSATVVVNTRTFTVRSARKRLGRVRRGGCACVRACVRACVCMCVCESVCTCSFACACTLSQMACIASCCIARSSCSRNSSARSLQTQHMSG